MYVTLYIVCYTILIEGVGGNSIGRCSLIVTVETMPCTSGTTPITRTLLTMSRVAFNEGNEEAHKDWVFQNYTFKRFEGLTQRGLHQGHHSQWAEQAK